MSTLTYLYGDSTDSGLELNYIELLRDFLDVAALMMVSDQRTTDAKNLVLEKKQRLASEIQRLRGLGDTVLASLSEFSEPSADPGFQATTVVRNCRDELDQAIQQTVSKVISGLDNAVQVADQELTKVRKRESAANERFLEHLLLHHDLPDSHNYVNIGLNPQRSGYAAEVIGENQQGLSWRFAAEIPRESGFYGIRKVGSMFPGMTLELPEKSGFFRKRVELQSHRIASFYICSCSQEGEKFHVQLRASLKLGDKNGFDVTWTAKTKTISVARSKNGESAFPQVLGGAGAVALAELCSTLQVESQRLASDRSALTEILFDDKPFSDCDDPKELVSRLVSRLGPAVRGIVEHSVVSTELVLKRVMVDGRREEIYASKAALLEKLSIVPPKLRGIFAPLGLGELHDSGGTDRSLLPEFSSGKELSQPVGGVLASLSGTGTAKESASLQSPTPFEPLARPQKPIASSLPDKPKMTGERRPALGLGSAPTLKSEVIVEPRSVGTPVAPVVPGKSVYSRRDRGDSTKTKN